MNIVTRLSDSVLKLGLKLFAALPLSAARALGNICGNACNITKNSVYRVTKINLQMTHAHLSSQALEALSKQSTRSTMINSFEMPVVWNQSDQWIADKIERIENLDIVTNSIAQGKGVIVLCPHIGNWEVFGRYLSTKATTTYLYQPPKIIAFEELVKSSREKTGAKLVATNQRGVASLLKALRKGEVTGILPDQAPHPKSGRYADFFSVPAFTMTLIHGLIQKTDCKVVLGFCLRTEKGFRIIFQTVPERIYSEDVQLSVDALNQAVEQAIAHDISQYQWAYKRFKYQPNAPNPYRLGKNAK